MSATPFRRPLFLRRPKSIRGKLVRIVLSTTAIALLVAAIAMLTYDLVSYRQTVVAGLSAEAEILALSTAPALAFDDHAVALNGDDRPFDDLPFFAEVTRLDAGFEEGSEGISSGSYVRRLLVMGA